MLRKPKFVAIEYILTKDQLRIVFIGTPDFAVASLKRILEEGYRVVGVITAPDRPAGRGLKVQESAVKRFAVEKGLKVLQPTNLKSPEFQSELKSLEAHIQVVIAFRMLPEAVWDMPPLGTFNLHASLLPAYRGAAPINRAIMNGEKETGVSTFFLKHEIDTGNIIYREKVAIGSEETAGELHDRLMLAGAELVVKTLDAVCTGEYPQIPQESGKDAPTAPKLFKEDCELQASWPLEKIFNHVRGLSPYPGAFTRFKGKQMKIFSAVKQPRVHSLPLGTWEYSDRKHLLWACSDGFLEVLELQLEGKKRMGAAEFLRGLQ